MPRIMTRQQFGLRLLSYHGGGGTATYALGSSIVAGVPIHTDMIEACRDEMHRDVVKFDRHFARAICIWGDVLDKWLATGTPPWEVPHG